MIIMHLCESTAPGLCFCSRPNIASKKPPAEFIGT